MFVFGIVCIYSKKKKRKKKKKETNWLAVKELKDRVGSGSMKTREIK